MEKWSHETDQSQAHSIHGMIQRLKIRGITHKAIGPLFNLQRICSNLAKSRSLKIWYKRLRGCPVGKGAIASFAFHSVVRKGKIGGIHKMLLKVAEELSLSASINQVWKLLRGYATPNAPLAGHRKCRGL